MAYELPIPEVKLTLGSTDYYDVVKEWSVKLRENNYNTAKLVINDPHSLFYKNRVDMFDEVAIYIRNRGQSWGNPLFGGYARELLPAYTVDGAVLVLGCKGYGAALEETHCNRDYGAEATDQSYPRPWNIWTNVLSDFVNKSFDDWSTNHALTYTYITDAFADDITYINNPYRRCVDVVNHVCDITCAIEAGTDAENPTAAGAHWRVDASKRFMVGRIGDHEDGTNAPYRYWPDWWEMDSAHSTLTQGIDFKSPVRVIEKSTEFANSVLLYTDLRRPSGDYWTTDAVANGLWGDVDVTQADDAVTKLVGNDSLKATCDAAGYAWLYYPSTEDAGWNIDDMGSSVSPPTIEFYFMENAEVINCVLILFTTDHDEDAYVIDFTDWNLEHDVWHHFSIPIGTYYRATSQPKEVFWENGEAGCGIAAGNPDWTDINGICFAFAESSPDGIIHIDDLHFTGKVCRQAYCSDNITTNKEWQKIFLSRFSMDDTCLSGTPGTTDVGDAARTAKAELLRRIRNPITVEFTVGLRKTMLEGQKLHLKAGKKLGGTYALDSDMRIMTVEHGVNALVGAYSTVMATDDLYNTRPISSLDSWALQQEFTLVNSKEAIGIRAGAEVDLLMPILKEDYT